MKTKLFSKILLIASTVFIIAGCNTNEEKEDKNDAAQDTASTNLQNDSNKKAKAVFEASDCEICNDLDTYKIKPDSVLILVNNFHNEFIKTNKVSNAGGFISFETNSKISTSSLLSGYSIMKFHWGFQINETYKRLFITLEKNNITKKCVDNKYEGTSGIESTENLYTSYPENDIKPYGPSNAEITTTEVLKGLMDKQKIKIDLEKLISTEEAKAVLKNFSDNLPGIYQCEDIVFDNVKTGAVIKAACERNSLIYFFGYDEKQTYHKLRLIIAGVDKENKIVFYNANDFMFRENSRPRP
jgi:hypothetical protein